MHILILASGSGGHVYPALSFIKQNKEEQFTYLKIKNGFENKYYKDGITFDIQNQFKKYIKNPINFIKLLKEIKRNKKILKEVDVILSFGGFVSFLGFLLALFYKKKLFIHEQNYMLGDGNRLAKIISRKVFLSFQNDKYKGDKFIVAGNPRIDELKNNKKYHPNFNVLFFAGSLSSSSLNKVIEDILKDGMRSDIYFYVVSGSKEYKRLKQYEKNNIKILEYVDNMPEFLSLIDLLIIRGGATTISEVINLNIVSIIIPSPNVKHDHQTENARVLQEIDGARVIEEKDLNKERLISEIISLKDDKLSFIKMQNNLRKLARKDVSKTILREMKK